MSEPETLSHKITIGRKTYTYTSVRDQTINETAEASRADIQYFSQNSREALYFLELAEKNGSTLAVSRYRHDGTVYTVPSSECIGYLMEKDIEAAENRLTGADTLADSSAAGV